MWNDYFMGYTTNHDTAMKEIRKYFGGLIFILLILMTAIVLPLAVLCMFVIWLLMGGSLDDFVTGSYALLLMHLANIRKTCEYFY